MCSHFCKMRVTRAFMMENARTSLILKTGLYYQNSQTLLPRNIYYHTLIRHQKSASVHQPFPKQLLSPVLERRNKPVPLVKNISISRDPKLPIIYLFTKDGCTLCDEAKDVLQPYRHRFTLIEVNITLPDNADWFKKYQYHIPVFHIHEEFLFQHRVDLGRLEQALSHHEKKVK